MKKFLQFAAVAAVVFVFTSCADDSVEGKTKAYLEKIEQYKIEKAELAVEMLEEGVEYYEYLEDLDKKDLRKAKRNNVKWRKEVYKEYEKELENLKEQEDKIQKKVFRAWDEKILPRLLETGENEE